MCMCMYVCMCVYKYVCMYVCMYVYINIHTSVYIHTYIHTCMYVYVCVCVYIGKDTSIIVVYLTLAHVGEVKGYCIILSVCWQNSSKSANISTLKILPTDMKSTQESKVITGIC